LSYVIKYFKKQCNVCRYWKFYLSTSYLSMSARMPDLGSIDGKGYGIIIIVVNEIDINNLNNRFV